MLYCLSTAHEQRAADVPVTVTQELAQLRMEHANMLGQHRSLTDVLSRRETELKQLEGLLVAEQNRTSTLKFRLQSTEAASLRAEKRAKTAQQEADMVNALLVRRAVSSLRFPTELCRQERFTTQQEDGDETAPADVTAHSNMRIAALESVIEELKEANEALASEMNEMGGDAAQVISGPGRGSISALKAALSQERLRVSNMAEELSTARGEVARLEKRVASLDEQLFRLQGDVGTGHHVPPGIRVLEMVGNPASKWFGKREEDVQRLRKENEALRSMMGDGVARPTEGAAVDGLVPKETLDVLIQEKAELEKTIKEKEKRLLRLQQVHTQLHPGSFLTNPCL
jgi:mitotic spindle assembly checkpoint protein MAD1